MAERARMLELFGSDSEDEGDDAAEAEPLPSLAPAANDEQAEDDGLDVEEDDLFGGGGDDDDDADGASRAPAEEPAQPLHFELPELPRNKGGKLSLVKLPNILRIEPRMFDAEHFEGEEVDAAEVDEGDESSARRRTKNVIRWRENKESGAKESNTRLVRWSDGSMTLHVGNEVLAATAASLKDGTAQIFARHKGSTLECHGVVDEKLGFQPASIHSTTHKELTEHIARRHIKEKRIKMVAPPTVAPEMTKREDERTWDDKNRLERRQASRSMRDAQRGPELSADFLDDDDGAALEGNLGALKRRFKEGKGKPKKKAAGGARRFGRRRDDDEEDGEDDEFDDDDADWDKQEKEAAASGEMDGFIVDGDEDDAEEGEDSDEFGAMSDSDDEPVPPKKKGRR